MGRTVTLRQVEDAGGVRNLQATIDDSGLVIAGHDLGPGVQDTLGAAEYEWARTIATEHLDTLQAHLGGPILDVLQAEYADDNAVHLDRMLEESGVPIGYWSRIGD